MHIGARLATNALATAVRKGTQVALGTGGERLAVLHGVVFTVKIVLVIIVKRPVAYILLALRWPGMERGKGVEGGKGLNIHIK